MRNTFPRKEWVEYACDTLPPDRKAAMDKHIAECAECRAISAQLLQVDRRLVAAAALLRESLPPESIPAREAFEEWRNRVGVAPESGFVPQGLLRMELFLTPICGFRTAERAMLVATRQALAESVDLLTEVHWPAFVDSLSSIASALCGEPAGDLLREIGRQAA